MGQESKRTTWNLIAKMLTGEATPEENQALEKVLKENPELHYSMQTITDLWKSSADPDISAAESAYDRHLDRLRRIDTGFPAVRNPRRRLRVTIGVSALVLLVALAFWLSRPEPSANRELVAGRPAAATNEVKTANGSRTHL